MAKLSDDTFENFGRGLQVAFGPTASNTVRFYAPEALANARRPSSDMAVAAPMPTPANTEPTVSFIPPIAANG